MTPAPAVARAATGRRWSMLVLIAAVVAGAITARLGIWQLARADQKIALRESIEQRGRELPIPQPALARSPEQATAQHYRPVRLAGEWLAAATVYLDNRQMNGQPGFFVITPLLLAPGDAVLVQRGWIPRNSQDRSALAPVVTPMGRVTVGGIIAPPPSRLFEFSGGSAGPIRQNLDLAAYAREIGVPLRPLSIQQDDDAGTAGDGLLRQWPRAAIDVSMHYGYAFQWFALSALIAGLYVWFQILRPRFGRARR